jgi:hypothetical protein
MYGVSLGMGLPCHIITIFCTPWIPFFFVLLLGATDTLGWLPYVHVLLFYLSSWRIHAETTAWRLARPKPIGQAIHVSIYLFIYSLYHLINASCALCPVPRLVHYILLAMSSAVDT